jgi:hypothetical protein
VFPAGFGDFGTLQQLVVSSNKLKQVKPLLLLLLLLPFPVCLRFVAPNISHTARCPALALVCDALPSCLLPRPCVCSGTLPALGSDANGDPAFGGVVVLDADFNQFSGKPQLLRWAVLMRRCTCLKCHQIVRMLAARGWSSSMHAWP